MPISGAWDETSPPGSQAVSLGDDRIREFKRDIRERLANFGHYIPTGAAGASGALFTGTGNFVGSEVAIYDALAGAPDLATKLFRVTGTAHGSGRTVTMGANTTVSGTIDATGTIRQGGTPVVLTTQKRIMALTVTGRGAGGGATSDDVRIANAPMVIPAAATAGANILEFYILRDELSGSTVTGIDLRWLSAPFGGGETLLTKPATGATRLNAVATMSAAQYGVKMTQTTPTNFIVAPILVAGDILLAIDSGTSPFGGFLTAIVIIELNY